MAAGWIRCAWTNAGCALALSISILGCPGKDEPQGAAGQDAKQAGDEKAPGADGKKAPDAKAAPANPLVGGKLKIGGSVPAGQKRKTSDSGVLNLTLTKFMQYQNMPEHREANEVKVAWRWKYTDTVKEVKDGRPVRIERKTESSTKTERNAQTGKMEPQDTPLKDSTVVLAPRDDGTVSLNEDADPQVADEYKDIRVGPILPSGEIAIGEEKDISEARLKAAVPLVTKGEGKIRLVSVALDPALNRTVARFEGVFRMDLAQKSAAASDPPIRFDGKITVSYLPDAGAEILRKIDGKVSFEGPPQISGPITTRWSGAGEFHSTTSAEILPAD